MGGILRSEWVDRFGRRMITRNFRRLFHAGVDDNRGRLMTSRFDFLSRRGEYRFRGCNLMDFRLKRGSNETSFPCALERSI